MILSTRRPHALAACLLIAIAGTLLAAPEASAQDNACDEPGDSPDVIVGSLQSIRRYGALNGITAFSIGTTSCNEGTCGLNWMSGGSNQHPTIGQHLYRLRDGRFEQLGQSWLKHGFFALSEDLCHDDCIGTDGSQLGVHCSDPYSSQLNGNQRRLGPKFEVNPSTGWHPHPFTAEDQTGDVIYKRLQVETVDLDPALNAGALYFIEGHYIAEDDHMAGNSANNASYREVQVEDLGGGAFDLDFIPGENTQRTLPGIQAWQDHDPSVVMDTVDIELDGRFILAANAIDLGGSWRYEYAVHNFNSHKSARSFSVPLPRGLIVRNAGFHDVDYHSGEPYDLTDWPADTGTPGVISWETDTFSDNPDANAVRWGTLYNFWFECDAGPTDGDVTVELFRPGTPTEFTATLIVPAPCDDDGSCEPGEDCLSCPGDCPSTGPDEDSDGSSVCEDCDDTDPTSFPGNFETVLDDNCEDGADNDCDGDVDCDDDGCVVDGDSDGTAAAPCGNDCDDADPTAFPGNSESAGDGNCGDGTDNDCDGDVDCDDDGCVVDGDSDGAAAPPCGNDCDDGDPDQSPRGSESMADGNCEDGEDNDCDGDVDCDDDGCNVDEDSDGLLAPPCGTDCDDTVFSREGPADLNCGDGLDNDCDFQVDCEDDDCSLADGDGDGYVSPPCGADCDDNDGMAWGTPGEVQLLLMTHVGRGEALLQWGMPREMGGRSVFFEVLRSETADDFVTSPSCATLGDPFGVSNTDREMPPGDIWYYLVRAANACAQGVGPVGYNSLLQARTAGDCP